MVIKCYYMPISGPCRALLLAAKYLDIDMQLIQVNLLEREQMKPQFRKMNPQHTIPTIDDNGYILWECRAIMQYLVNKYRPGHPVYPENIYERAITDRMLHFDIGTIVAAQVDVTVPSIILGYSPDKEKLEVLDEKLELLDKILEKSEFVCGSELRLPDISIVAYITTLKVANYDIYKFQNITRWVKKLREVLPDFERINDKGVELYKQMVDAGMFSRAYKPLQEYAMRKYNTNALGS